MPNLRKHSMIQIFFKSIKFLKNTKKQKQNKKQKTNKNKNKKTGDCIITTRLLSYTVVIGESIYISVFPQVVQSSN